MRLSSRNARIDAGGKHNDRNYDISLSPHVDPERLKDNRFITYKGEPDKTFEEIEKEFYEEHFSEHIKAQNERNIKNRHKERNRTLDKYYRAKLSRPEDRIIQIGDKNDHISGEVLWAISLEYMEKFNHLYGDHCKIIDMALHMDEETPHVQIRRVWIAKDKDGFEHVNEGKALEEMGIYEPDIGKEISKQNNAKITFTRLDRELIKDICKEHNIEIEPEIPGTVEHLPIRQYREMKAEEHTKKLEEKADELCETIETVFNEAPIREYLCDELERINKLSREERRLALLKLYEREIVKATASSEGSLENRMSQSIALMKANQMERFLKQNGLYEKFLEFKKEKEKQGMVL